MTVQEQRKEKANGQLLEITLMKDVSHHQFVTILMIYKKSTILRVELQKPIDLISWSPIITFPFHKIKNPI